MRDEILSGLRAAIEHGSSLDQAIQSFINAGYNPAEVKQAASSLREGATPIIAQQRKPKSQPSPTPQKQFPVSKEDNHSPIEKLNSVLPKKKNKKIFIIILLAVLLLLIGALVLFIFFNPFS